MNLLEIFFARTRLWQHRQEIDTLRTELDKLQQQNDSMREGMRRCVTCEYRIDVKQRQDDSIGASAQHSPAPLDHQQ
ncbi:MAG: hypothetical protein ACKVHM_05780 [Pseudomonadales bacterium]|jgi:hypothetical protein|tara:strand:- start:1034 stop:1264 length:231 start_codon:yes stop_codon:yes gene_type:complete